MGVLSLSLFAGFVALGTWQVHRFQWKTELIERVESRVHAAPAPAPGKERWANISAESDEYRHVKVSGHFLHALSTPIFASTELGNGYWVLTPFQLEDGSLVFVNRGFISHKSTLTSNLDIGNRVTLTGLLRITEPKGAYLRSNHQGIDRWYSRDVQAIATARELHKIGPIAPYFIDAKPRLGGRVADSHVAHEPVAGLTVIQFNNNHVVYAVTWYALALMTAACSVWFLRISGKH